ncbi:hypothetical protein [Bauldia sp.]|uniref:hypothetical protein n=1 Tax=Bauldia sp. TaxID=2575872 RepID=UPI003BAA7FC2
MPKQTTDLLSDGVFPILFDAPGLTWKIAKGVTVGASAGGGVIGSGEDDSTLINKGLIVNTALGGQGVIFSSNNNGSVVNKGEIVGGPLGAGVQLSGDNMQLANVAGAKILGGTIGVAFGSGVLDQGGNVENHGRIAGTDADSIGIGVAGFPDFVLKNYGEVDGQSHGVLLTINGSATTPGPKIVNHGLIAGDEAVQAAATDADGYRLKVVNKVDGTILGEAAAVFALSNESLRVVVKNDGLIVGDIETGGTESNDKVVNTGKIKGHVKLGDGADLVDNTGGRITKKIFGELGDDTFILGDRKETIVFDTNVDQGQNVDTVQNFETGADQFFLDQAVFAALVGLGDLAKANFRRDTTAQDADDYIVYDKATGVLIYDFNGNLNGGATQFAQLDPGTGLKHSDFTVFA